MYCIISKTWDALRMENLKRLLKIGETKNFSKNWELNKGSLRNRVLLQVTLPIASFWSHWWPLSPPSINHQEVIPAVVVNDITAIVFTIITITVIIACYCCWPASQSQYRGPIVVIMVCILKSSYRLMVTAAQDWSALFWIRNNTWRFYSTSQISEEVCRNWYFYNLLVWLGSSWGQSSRSLTSASLSWSSFAFPS